MALSLPIRIGRFVTRKLSLSSSGVTIVHSCNFCLRPAYVPVLVCKNKHLACTTCLNSFVHCSICVQDERNKARETMQQLSPAMSFPVKCSFEKCEKTVPRDQMEKHMKFCEFRNIKCLHHHAKNECKYYAYEDYLHHVYACHGYVPRMHMEWDQSPFVIHFSALPAADSLASARYDYNGYMWRSAVLIVKRIEFLVFARIINSTTDRKGETTYQVKIWVAGLMTSGQTGKHTARLSIETGGQTSNSVLKINTVQTSFERIKNRKPFHKMMRVLKNSAMANVKRGEAWRIQCTIHSFLDSIPEEINLSEDA